MKVDRNIGLEVQRRRLTYLSAERLDSFYQCLDEIANESIDGDFCEFGIALGGSGICLAHALGSERHFVGYDVFGMIPPPGEEDGEEVRQRYASIASGQSTGIGGDQYYGYIDNLYEIVKANFAAIGVPVDDARIRLVKGLFNDTVPATLPKRIALAHIDCDWHEPVRFCLNAVWPKLTTGGFVILDDYPDWLGCRKATDQFLDAEKSAVVIRTTPHAVLTKKLLPSL